MKTELAEFLFDGWDELDPHTVSRFVPRGDLMQIHAKAHLLRFVTYYDQYIHVGFYNNVHQQGVAHMNIHSDCLLFAISGQLNSVEFKKRKEYIKYLPKCFHELPAINGNGALKRFRERNLMRIKNDAR